MQLSAANLLIASQQAALAKPREAAPGGFADALKGPGSKPSFEPIAFRQTAASSIPAPRYAAAQGLGQQIDIKV